MPRLSRLAAVSDFHVASRRLVCDNLTGMRSWVYVRLGSYGLKSVRAFGSEGSADLDFRVLTTFQKG